MNTTIHQLRQNGFKVRVIHYRYNQKNDLAPLVLLKAKNTPISSKGGVTEIQLRSPSGTEVFGVSHCHTNDAFNRSLGNAKALGRAISALSKIEPINLQHRNV